MILKVNAHDLIIAELLALSRALRVRFVGGVDNVLKMEYTLISTVNATASIAGKRNACYEGMGKGHVCFPQPRRFVGQL